MRARVVAVLALAAGSALVPWGCRRDDKKTPEEVTKEIEALERERDLLRAKVDEMLVKDPRIAGMPTSALRVGIPTTLTRELIEKTAAGFVDQVELRLTNIHATKKGTVRKVVRLGAYDLDVLLEEIKGRLKTEKPKVNFGGNKISVALPVKVASGEARATIHFKWEGQGMGGAVCGDLDVTRQVSGGVKPDDYPVAGTLILSATAQEILASPRFPKIRINLKADPTPESWATAQAILDEKTGVCGFAVDKVDVMGIVRRIVEKGFNVTLPTEKLKAMAVPLGIAPTMTVRGKPIALGIKVGHLAITEDMIWLGADVTLSPGAPEPSPSPSASPGPAAAPGPAR